jgi:hypothetical protein
MGGRGNNSINFYIRRGLNIPLYRKKTLRNAKVILYKDENSNGIKDESEGLIAFTQILLNKTLLQTNESGELNIQNYLGNVINLDLMPANNLMGWVPGAGFKQDIPISNGETIFIPFKRSKLITGRLNIDKDEKSTTTFDPAGIRITANGRLGGVFSTLTGADGTFYMNVVDDEYTLSINQNVFDEQFKIIDPIKSVDLIHNKQVSVSFLIRQKRREMKIKKE